VSFSTATADFANYGVGTPQRNEGEHQGLGKPIEWVFPKLLVCVDCGFAEFAIPESQVRRLAERDPTAA